VYAIDAQTGDLRDGWPFTQPTDIDRALAVVWRRAVVNDTIYFGSNDSKLYALE
jgi:outer membrane protein assembly factor BamB